MAFDIDINPRTKEQIKADNEYKDLLLGRPKGVRIKKDDPIPVDEIQPEPKPESEPVVKESVEIDPVVKVVPESIDGLNSLDKTSLKAVAESLEIDTKGSKSKLHARIAEKLGFTTE
ncbi:MAG: hypothetical protein GY861_11615 [bacterium]|nr:hypothetical protein [bacterium]